MSNILNNTAGLQAILEAVNALPEANIPTETVTESSACTVTGQCYASNAGAFGSYSSSTCYAGANTSNYYAYVMKFRIPTFKGTSKNIKFTLNIKSNYHANISLNYALTTSDANKDSYKRTYASVSDSNQIASGLLTMNSMSTSSYGNWPLDISTSALQAETDYYLFLWGTSNSTLTTVNNTTDHTIMLEYEYEKASGGGGASVETCTVNVFMSESETATTGGPVTRLLVTQYEDGKCHSRYDIGPTLENVVVGSGLYINSLGNLVISGDCEILDRFSFGDKSYNYFFKPTGNATLNFIFVPCFVKGTPVRLANNSEIAVENITYDDNLLVWDFDNGCYTSAKPLWIKRVQTASNYYRCEFENGSVLKLVGSNGKCHRIFSIDKNSFESATDCVGNMVMTDNGPVRLVRCDQIEETVDFYNIITERHLNLFANSVLTSCRLNNLYLIKDMRFVKDARPVITKDRYPDISEAFYYGLRLDERYDSDVDAINEYVKRMQSLMLDKEALV